MENVGRKGRKKEKEKGGGRQTTKEERWVGRALGGIEWPRERDKSPAEKVVM